MNALFADKVKSTAPYNVPGGKRDGGNESHSADRKHRGKHAANSRRDKLEHLKPILKRREFFSDKY